MLFFSNVNAADVYEPSTNVLSIPIVYAGGVSYRNVQITVGIIKSVEQGFPKSEFDQYDALTNTLNIPSVRVGAITYTNVSISVGQILCINCAEMISKIFVTSYGGGSLTVKSMDSGVLKDVVSSEEIILTKGEKVEITANSTKDVVLDGWQGEVNDSLQIPSKITFVMNTDKRIEGKFVNRSIGIKKLQNEFFDTDVLDFRTSANFVVWWDKRRDENYIAKYILNWAEKVLSQGVAWGLPLPNRSDKTYLNIYLHRKTNEGGHTNLDVFSDEWVQGVSTDRFGMPFYTSPVSNLKPLNLTETYSSILGNLFHEVFHLMQWQATRTNFKYTGDNRWYIESMATWFEIENAPLAPISNGNWYWFLGGIPAFTFQPQKSLWSFNDGTTWSHQIHGYGAAIFLKYLTDNNVVTSDFFAKSLVSGWTRSPVEYLYQYIPNFENVYRDFSSKLPLLDGYSKDFRDGVTLHQEWTDKNLKSNFLPDGRSDNNTYVARVGDAGTNGYIAPLFKNEAWSYTTTRMDASTSGIIRVSFRPSLMGSNGSPSRLHLSVGVNSNGAIKYHVLPTNSNQNNFIDIPVIAGSSIFAVVTSTPNVFSGKETFDYSISLERVSQ